MEELQPEAAELAFQLEKAREDPSRLEITRETVVLVLAVLSAAESGEGDPVGRYWNSRRRRCPLASG
ncbi:hypothetical protein AB0B50_44095 [Streptomyces sp. NPDC041068]|uniref:hypothetical protein n=1 Tax=Streptomyces sp. NPDC041068 TaxID=3155130 RepID=UPI0033C99D18